MTREELQAAITNLEPQVTFEEAGEFLNAVVPSELCRDLMQALHNMPDLSMDYMFCLTCVDWKTHLTMVYHLESTAHGHQVVIKSQLNRENPEIETLSDIWRTAELLEREVFDLFGVRFIHHPDLRRLLLTDEWEGWPMRKDYEDPINMIKL
ncbi:MAG TPA: NADH-quinone oxidoreductase subunit C [Chitinophagales bacterium]|nr:NADH-quinone oxidoreductase subunit C [Chitinophagales bacterium]HNI54519.1 NADH-quinone oxidoreductase subunit C [Chitinophagales bacterium]HNK97998.1 NADH-quinone oxidoreductase subunit C [Chitinophagales bacterium]HNM07017.1 NADH-quinone oxidoreductase subunit C [Chitinophagales bacterium]HNM28991.1 NADH-quinone oxidoreductase subunit C [Chitinophagales bacterium]